MLRGSLPEGGLASWRLLRHFSVGAGSQGWNRRRSEELNKAVAVSEENSRSVTELRATFPGAL